MGKIIIDEIFGEIKKKGIGYETKVRWVGGEVTVFFSYGIEAGWDEEQEMKEVYGAIEKAKKFFQEKEKWDEKMKDVVSEYGLNSVMDWVDVEEEEELEGLIERISENSEIELSEKDIEKLKEGVVPEEIFRNSIYLESLNISSDGEFSAYYYDNEIFFLGHAIQLSGNINGELEYDGEVG